MRVEPLIDYLEAQSVGSKGKDLFANFFPQKTELAVMIHSGLMATPIDAELPLYRAAAKFQVVVRCRDYAAGFALMQAITDALITEQRRQIGNMLFNFIRPFHEPLDYPLSTGNLIEISVNFDCNYVLTG